MKEQRRVRKVTSLAVEEHEGLVEGEGVVVRGWMGMVVAWHHLDDEGDEAGQEGRDKQSAHRPDEDLAADDDAAQIHVLLLLLLAGAQQPALLGLVQRPRQRRPVQVLQIAAAVVVCGGVRRVYLQGPTPRIPSVHAYLFLISLSFGLMSGAIGELSFPNYSTDIRISAPHHKRKSPNE